MVSVDDGDAPTPSRRAELSQNNRLELCASSPELSVNGIAPTGKPVNRHAFQTVSKPFEVRHRFAGPNGSRDHRVGDVPAPVIRSPLATTPGFVSKCDPLSNACAVGVRAFDNRGSRSVTNLFALDGLPLVPPS